jgi:hypothetical protein
MQFIEALFGISPDGGTGLLEGCLILVPLILLAFRLVLKRGTRSGTEQLRA